MLEITDEQIALKINEHGGGADVIYNIGIDLLNHDDPRCATYLERAAKLGSSTLSVGGELWDFQFASYEV